MRIRCPNCHADYSIDQAVEDEAARELMGVLSDLPREVSRPLTAYLGLFRARTRALAWERALRLAREAQGLAEDQALLGAALSETVEAMRAKQQESGWRPLTNHRYLKRVLESVEARGGALAPAATEAPRRSLSRTAMAIEALKNHTGPADVPDKLACVVCEAFQDWLLRSFEGQPSADLITAVADQWMRELLPRREWTDAELNRLRKIFENVGRKAERWPQPGDVLAHVPRMGVRT